MRDEPAPGPRGDALGLRLMAAAHRLALEGRAPEWATFLPSVREAAAAPLVDASSGRVPPGAGLGAAPTDPLAVHDIEAAWQALRDLIATRADELRPLVALPCQTNEVGRSAALAFGFFAAARTGLPLRLLEVGASAGLNLRFDHFRFGGGGASWGPEESPVNLEGLWLEGPPLPTDLRVVERAGCDRRPVDLSTEEGRLSLLSSVWADQQPRFARLRGALEIARRVPAPVVEADLAAWLPAQLEEARPGQATVVYHSIVDEYLPSATRQAFHECLDTAGARASRRRTALLAPPRAVPRPAHLWSHPQELAGGDRASPGPLGPARERRAAGPPGRRPVGMRRRSTTPSGTSTKGNSDRRGVDTVPERKGLSPRV